MTDELLLEIKEYAKKCYIEKCEISKDEILFLILTYTKDYEKYQEIYELKCIEELINLYYTELNYIKNSLISDNDISNSKYDMIFKIPENKKEEDILIIEDILINIKASKLITKHSSNNYENLYSILKPYKLYKTVELLRFCAILNLISIVDNSTLKIHISTKEDYNYVQTKIKNRLYNLLK